MDRDELDRIIREIISVHRLNYLENGDRARSKSASIKEIVEKNMNRLSDAD